MWANGDFSPPVLNHYMEVCEEIYTLYSVDLWVPESSVLKTRVSVPAGYRTQIRQLSVSWLNQYTADS